MLALKTPCKKLTVIYFRVEISELLGTELNMCLLAYNLLVVKYVTEFICCITASANLPVSKLTSLLRLEYDFLLHQI